MWGTFLKKRKLFLICCETRIFTGLRGKYYLRVGGGGVQGHKINPDNFVRNYVTPIRDTFTAWINISIYVISEIESRINSYQFIFWRSNVLRNSKIAVKFLSSGPPSK